MRYFYEQSKDILIWYDKKILHLDARLFIRFPLNNGTKFNLLVDRSNSNPCMCYQLYFSDIKYTLINIIPLGPTLNGLHLPTLYSSNVP